MKAHLLVAGLVREGFLWKVIVEPRSGGQVRAGRKQRQESEFCTNNTSKAWMNKEHEEAKAERPTAREGHLLRCQNYMGPTSGPRLSSLNEQE